MKAIIGFSASHEGARAQLHHWLLHDFALALAGLPDTEKIVFNFVQDPPEFLPRPPHNAAAPAPYDALLAVWSREDVLPELSVAHNHAARVDSFVVEENVEKNELEERAGKVTPGIKNLPFLIYKPALSVEEGRAKWDAHAKLGLRIHTGMKRYVRNFVTARSAGAPHIDGIAEVSFGSLDELRTGLFPTPEDRNAFLADVAGFVQANVTHYSIEHVIKW